MSAQTLWLGIHGSIGGYPGQAGLALDPHALAGSILSRQNQVLGVEDWETQVAVKASEPRLSQQKDLRPGGQQA